MTTMMMPTMNEVNFRTVRSILYDTKEIISGQKLVTLFQNNNQYPDYSKTNLSLSGEIEYPCRFHVLGLGLFLKANDADRAQIENGFVRMNVGLKEMRINGNLFPMNRFIPDCSGEIFRTRNSGRAERLIPCPALEDAKMVEVKSRRGGRIVLRSGSSFNVSLTFDRKLTLTSGAKLVVVLDGFLGVPL